MSSEALSSLTAAAGIFLLSYAFMTPGSQLFEAVVGGALVVIGYRWMTDLDQTKVIEEQEAGDE